MNTVEATRQQLDPAGTFGAYRSTVVLVVVTLVWAVVMSFPAVRAADAIPLVFCALLLVVTAGVWLLWAANPLRAPFTRTSMVVVYALGVGAGICASFATFGHDRAGDDWIPVAIGVLTVAITPYRPAQDLIACLGVVTLALSIVMLVELPTRYAAGPGLALIVAGLTPMLAVGVASIQYSRYLVQGLGRWQRRADVAAASLASEMVSGVATLIEREHLAILSRDVAPFFTELLQRETLTDAHRTRARVIADSMRLVMVADADRTWLSMTFRDTTRGPQFLTVDDPSFAAGYMDARQRTAVRAILVALAEDERVTSVTTVIRAVDAVATFVLQASLELEASATVAGEYDTYFSVLRVVFDSFQKNVEEHAVIVRFEYDCA